MRFTFRQLALASVSFSKISREKSLLLIAFISDAVPTPYMIYQALVRDGQTVAEGQICQFISN